jgi:hypothetical protein
MSPRSILVVLGVAAATVAAELAWLPAGARKTPGPDGDLHGPYTTGEVTGLVVTLLVIAVLGTLLLPRLRGGAGWLQPIGVAAALTGALTVTWSAVAAADPGGDGLWPVGAFLILVGSAVGAGAVAYAVHGLRVALRPGPPQPGWQSRPGWS